MPPRVKVKLTGYNQALSRAKTLEELIPLIAARALKAEAKRMIEKSKQVVPVVTGKLRSAAYVKQPVLSPKAAFVEIGYDPEIAPYAFSAHFTPRLGKTGGVDPQGKPYPSGTWAREGQWMFLEEPVNSMAKTAKARMAADIKETLRLAYASRVK